MALLQEEIDALRLEKTLSETQVEKRLEEEADEAWAEQMSDHADEVKRMGAELVSLRATRGHVSECKLEGVSRFNLTDDGWHEANRNAASHLFGFHTWYEMLDMLWAMWPQVGRLFLLDQRMPVALTLPNSRSVS
jgi:hypothetical protein